MKKFRKKPVVIEAVKWDETRRTLDMLENEGMRPMQYNSHVRETYVHNLDIKTLEGKMRASLGDWIIKGIKGEFYPCKPDVFEATYDAVE